MELKIECILGIYDKTHCFSSVYISCKMQPSSGDYRIRLLVPYAVSGGSYSRVELHVAQVLTGSCFCFFP